MKNGDENDETLDLETSEEVTSLTKRKRDQTIGSEENKEPYEDKEDGEEEDEDKENSEDERLTLRRRMQKKQKVEVPLLELDDLQTLCDDVGLFNKVTNKISKVTGFCMTFRGKLYKDDVFFLCPC